MNIVKVIAASLVVISMLAACGGGGTSSPTSKTIVNGIASKGPFIKDSVVKVYAIHSGTKGTLLIETKTADNIGSYSADLGNYTGPVLVEVSGSYLDEATGRIVQVSNTTPIRAALPHAQGTVTLPVTPLTELALQQTGGTLTPDAITTANALITSVFKVDIISTLPVAPTVAAIASATQAQKDYTLALATISQMASEATGSTDTEKLLSTLAILSQGTSSTGMTTTAVESFHTALSNFVTTNPNNQTGISDPSMTSLVSVGTLSKSYTLSLQGIINPGLAKGIQFSLGLPSGVTVNINNTDASVLTSSLTISSNAPSDTMLAATASAGVLVIGIATTQGIVAGSFASLTCNIPSGTTIPPASAFEVNNLKVVDAKGTPITGVTVTVN